MQYPISTTQRPFLQSDTFFRIILVLLGIGLLFFIILIKSRAASIIWTSPLLFIYTLFVTTFELSRLLAAMFYKDSLDAVGNYMLPSLAQYEPTVSFVIPCKNEEASIAKTVNACFAAHHPKEKLEVIVVNDGSTDGTLAVVQELQKKYGERMVVINWSINKGKRLAMAQGMRQAKGEIIVQLDSDSFLEPSAFPYLIQPFRNPTVGAVCAHTNPENANENLLTKMQVAYYFMSFRILKAAESVFLTVFCCSGCCSAYRASVIKPIIDKWTSETFLGLPVTWGDDRALTNWVLRQDYRTIYTEQARAYTRVPSTFSQFLKQQTRWKKGWFVNSIFALKFLPKKEPFVAITYFIPLFLVTLLAPFMATRALIYNPIFHNSIPTPYVVGVLLVAAIIVIFYRFIERENHYWPYLFLWAILNTVFLSFILFWALLTIQDRRWGTR